MKQFTILVLAFACFAMGRAEGQATTGAPPFGSMAGGPFDTIDLANLNVHFAVPVVHKTGRGIPFTYDLSYDNSVWIPSYWTPALNWGWRGQSEIVTGYVSYSTVVHRCYGENSWLYYNEYTGWVYHDPWGIQHRFGVNVYDTSTAWCAPTLPFSGTATTTDGSGYSVSVDATPSATVSARTGATINAPLNNSAGGGAAMDSNGNQISTSGSVIVDTLGVSEVTVAGSGTPASPMTFSYPAPNNTSKAVTVNYGSFTVQSEFAAGCATGSDFNQSGVSLVTGIVLGDGSSYAINYEANNVNPSAKTGRIASISLPTGGVISYAYSGGVNGIVCSDGSTATLTRTTPDGTWTYTRTQISGSEWETVVLDPAGNETDIYFQGLYETERIVHQGGATGPVLSTVDTCYNGASGDCRAVAVALPITQRMVTTTVGGLQKRRTESYNTYGLPTEVDEFDWNSLTTPVRKTVTSYLAAGSNRPTSVTIEDGSNTVAAQTTWSYDQTPVTATTGTPQHVVLSGGPGNPTTITSLVGGTSAALVKTLTYFDTGLVQTATDVNYASTTYAFNSTGCANSLPTSATQNDLHITYSATWDCNGGVMLTSTDANNQTTSFAYQDPFWRTSSVTDPTGAITNYTYANSNSIQSTLVFGPATVETLTTLDALGRPMISQTLQPGGTAFDSTETDYDSLGRPRRVTVPYQASSGQQNNAAAATTTAYDALSRPTTVTDGGGGQTTYTYNLNDSRISSGGKQRQLEYDGLGRLRSVCEISSQSGSGACAQNTAATGFFTQYAYDLLGDATTVTQGTLPQRTYQSDDLGRMTLENNPESGTVSYVYDSDATCGSSPGDLVKRVDNAANTTCYAYDKLHRIVAKTYATQAGYTTSERHFVYDVATVNGQSIQNPVGQMVEAYTGPSNVKVTDLMFSYSKRGEVTNAWQWSTHSGGWYAVSGSYWANGVLNVLNGPGIPQITFNLDGAGRILSSSVAGGQNPLASTTYQPDYNAGGTPPPPYTKIALGSGATQLQGLDPQTGRPNLYQATLAGGSVTGTPTWNQNGTLASVATVDNFNGANTQTCSFAYDDMGRVASSSCGVGGNGVITYDAFGNILQKGAASATYTNNQIAADGYNANGDMTTEANLHTYAWDAEGELVGIDNNGTTATYDALGRMVELGRAGGYNQLVYGLDGSKLALMSGQTAVKCWVGLPGGVTAVYASGTLSNYRHPDWLGSARLSSGPSNNWLGSLSYGPFGEQYAQGGTTDPSFAGHNPDTVTDLYDSWFRRYSSRQGRWLSPDPAGASAAEPTDPQSWNRYAYVSNQPLTATDPMGLEEGNCSDVFYAITHAECPGIAPIGLELGLDILFSIGSGGGGGGVVGPAILDRLPAGHGNGQPLNGETDGIPNGLRVQWPGPLGSVLPTNPNCDFGYCGGPQNFNGAGVIAIPAGEALGGAICVGSGVCEAIAVGVVVVVATVAVAELGKAVINEMGRPQTNEIVDLVKSLGLTREAGCVFLKKLYATTKDSAKRLKIQAAQKYYRCRNFEKRNQ